MTNETTNDTDSTTGSGSSPLTHSPLWLNIAEVSFLLPVAILVLISSSIVLLVIFRTPKLHRTPGFLMLVLSSVDILIALFDQGYSIGELGGKIFDKDLQPFGIFCQVSLLFEHHYESKMCTGKAHNFVSACSRIPETSH